MVGFTRRFPRVPTSWLGFLCLIFPVQFIPSSLRPCLPSTVTSPPSALVECTIMIPRRIAAACFSGFTIQEAVRPGRPVYLDMQATTPMDPRVLDAMLPFYMSDFGNPHSRTHAYGWSTSESVETARKQVADLISAEDKEIVFTSGATESNNLALKGAARFYRAKGKTHIVTTQTEHKCVLDTCRHLQEEGFTVTYLPVQSNGLVEMSTLEQALQTNTALVSVMSVHNEIGVIQPIKDIGALCRRKGVLFHTDAAQAVGKIPIDVNDCNIDLMSISGHKIYGPKGVGALYVRRKPRVRLVAQMNGGGQERGFRSGTLAPPLVVGLGAACHVAQREIANDRKHVAYLSKRLYEGVMREIPEVQLNGDRASRYEGNLNFSFAFVEGESLLMGLKTVALSSGSACTSASLEPSYVLRALGVDPGLSHTSLRIGLGRFTTEAEIDFVLSHMKQHVSRLRAMSPLWEMSQEGIDISKIEWSQPH